MMTKTMRSRRVKVSKREKCQPSAPGKMKVSVSPLVRTRWSVSKAKGQSSAKVKVKFQLHVKLDNKVVNKLQMNCQAQQIPQFTQRQI